MESDVGRKPTVNNNLPPRMRARRRGSTVYYYYDQGGRPRREIALGTDYILAVRRWSELHQAPAPAVPTIGWAIIQYLASPAFDDVSTGTQADYQFALDKLRAKFGDAPLDEVRPEHVQIYIDLRSRESRHRALREKAVLSMLFAWCIARGYCESNPAAAIRTRRLPGRKHVYVTDDMLDAVYSQAGPAMRDALDLAYFTGQRPADVLRMAETDIRDGVLTVVQGKTGKVVRIAVEGGLADLVQRMLARKRLFSVQPLQLLVDERGKPMTAPKLRARFEAARDAAGIPGAAFQFRDLRRKAGTKIRDDSGIEHAQDLLGHTSVKMTEHYTGGKIRTARPPSSRG